MDSSLSDRNPVEELAEDFVARLRRGERPSLREYTDRFPEWADKIRALFPTLLVMEKVRPDPAATGLDGGLPAHGAHPERLGDYRIIREVGHGGMGVVYEAEQESLGRHVALKVLPAQAVLDPRHLQRFKREARAAGRLHHTNIVPVHGVGEHDGQHYYVMQFIQGQGLDQVLAELLRLRHARQVPAADPANGTSAAAVARSMLTGQFAVKGLVGAETAPGSPAAFVLSGAMGGSSSNSGVHLPGQSESTSLSETGWQYWHSVARIGIQVADALAYAASQGILHRDIKPSNLLLDTRGTVWVTDFGLAKAETDQDNVTTTGDIVGTLRYMAPERFQGAADVRGDLYALGLTLYELLTLRPAFDETDRHKLVAQVMHDQPPRPSQFDPAIPRDLETIVLKATAREPAQRYQTPAELAEDLQRFLDDRPIKARRQGPAQRAWRWCRRNPALAGVAAGLVTVLLAGTATSTWQAVRATQAEIAAQAEQKQTVLEQRQTMLERVRADAEKARAEENLKLALETLDETFVFVHEVLERINPDIPPEDGITRLRNQQAASTRLRNQKVASTRFTDQERKFLDKGLAFYGKFSESNNTDPLLRREQGKAFWRLGYVHTRLAQYEQAEAVYRKGIPVLERLVEEFPDAMDCREQFLSCHYWLSRVLADTGRFREAEDAFRRTIAVAEKMEAKYATTGADPSLHLWRSHTALRRLLNDGSRPQDVEKSYVEELAFWEKWQKLVTDLPTKPEGRARVAIRYKCLINCLIGNGDRLKRAGQLQAAKEQWEKAAVNGSELIELNLDDPFAWNHRGVAYARLGHWDRSAADHTKAIELNPNVGAIWANRAYAYLKLGFDDKARADCAKATGLVGDDPQASVTLGNIELELQRWDEAFRHYAKVIQLKADDAPALDGAIAACRKLTALRPDNPNIWYCLAQAHLTAGDRAEYRRVCADMLNRFGTTKDPGVADRVLYTCVPTPDALDDMAVLLPLAELAAANNGNARVLGAVFYRTGKYQEAIEPLKLGQSRAWDHLFLAMAHHRLGQTEIARNYLKRATEQLNPNSYGWPENVESELLHREAEALINGTGAAVPGVAKQ